VRPRSAADGNSAKIEGGFLRRIRRTWGLLLALLALSTWLGCGNDTEPTTAPPDNTGKVAPDFRLPDVNSTSTTHDQQVSPRDYLRKISAWYFGSAT
jgi:hypothetical protein